MRQWNHVVSFSKELLQKPGKESWKLSDLHFILTHREDYISVLAKVITTSDENNTPTEFSQLLKDIYYQSRNNSGYGLLGFFLAIILFFGIQIRSVRNHVLKERGAF